MDVFVAGTDTSCGKTVVTASIAKGLAPDVAIIKPVQTGYPPDDDAAWAALVSGARSVVLERYRDPLAPAVCARRENRPLELPDLCDRTLSVQATHRICESAGGIAAPLTDDATMLDLARRLGWPVVVATRPGLGTINHTTLTLRALDDYAIKTLGIVICGFRGGLVEETNLVELAKLARIINVIEWCDDIDTSLPPTSLSSPNRHVAT